jgi:hypothetical protein
MDTRDWVVIGLMGVIQLAGTIYLFVDRSPVNFVTWGTLCGTLISAYHWMVIRDSKQADAP